MEKIEKLKNILRDLGSVLVAYSGGVDSSFLLKIAKEVLGNKVLAVTAASPTYPKEELEFSKKIAKKLGVRHMVIHTYELDNNTFISNPANRCYFCKKELFEKLSEIAKQKKLEFVVDATNLTDKKDLRPGSKAKLEFGVYSPLAQAGFTKEDIRRESRKMGLPTWDKPSLACLASRIPYGVAITRTALKQINEAEIALRKLGFKQLRVRHYGDLARIEVEKKQIPRLIKNRESIVEKIKKLGYNYVTLDLEGYRTGSMNEVL